MASNKGKKPKFAIDEDLLGSDFSSLNKKIKLTNSAELMGRQGAEDIEFYEQCSAQGYHVITANVKDFRALHRSHPQFKVGVVGITGTSRDKSIKRFSRLVSEDMQYHEQYNSQFIEVSSTNVIVRSSNSTVSPTVKQRKRKSK